MGSKPGLVGTVIRASLSFKQKYHPHFNYFSLFHPSLTAFPLKKQQNLTRAKNMRVTFTYN